MSTENNYEQEAIELICAEVKHSAAALQGYLNTPRDGCVIVMDIERMADFAITEAADEIHDLYKLFEKS